MPADYQRLSRLLDLSAGNRTITDVGDSATDFLSDGGLILASDFFILITAWSNFIVAAPISSTYTTLR